MTQRPRRATRALMGALGAGVALIVGTAACSGGPTAPAPRSTTTTAATARTGSLASQADQLCAQIETALSDAKQLSPPAPGGLSGASKTISGDISALEGVVSGLQKAGSPSGHTKAISGIVASFRQAIGAGKAVAKDASAANFGLAARQLRSFGTDLSTARRRINAANLAHCANPTTTTTPSSG